MYTVTVWVQKINIPRTCKNVKSRMKESSNIYSRFCYLLWRRDGKVIIEDPDALGVRKGEDSQPLISLWLENWIFVAKNSQETNHSVTNLVITSDLKCPNVEFMFYTFCLIFSSKIMEHTASHIHFESIFKRITREVDKKGFKL